jgi:nucleotide-binding universal stress UspA family protein
MADRIRREVQANEVELIVMGYHARGRRGEAVPGCVSRSVLRKVNVPVLLVKLPGGH